MVTFSNVPGIVVKQQGKLTGAMRAERVKQGNGQMVETVRNAAGDVMKVSVFMDRNGDGRYGADEAVSVKYFDINSRSKDTREYRDLDGDGMADEVVKSNWLGNETVEKLGKSEDYPNGHDNDLMSKLYGGYWDGDDSMKMMHKGRALKADGSFEFK